MINFILFDKTIALTPFKGPTIRYYTISLHRFKLIHCVLRLIKDNLISPLDLGYCSSLINITQK